MKLGRLPSPRIPKARPLCGALKADGRPCGKDSERGGPCRWHKAAPIVVGSISYTSGMVADPVPAAVL